MKTARIAHREMIMAQGRHDVGRPSQYMIDRVGVRKTFIQTPLQAARGLILVVFGARAPEEPKIACSRIEARLTGVDFRVEIIVRLLGDLLDILSIDAERLWPKTSNSLT
jgi:hypothetical protein